MNGRTYRVVAIDRNGEITKYHGYMVDEDLAWRIRRDHLRTGAVVQHQLPPTVHPWLTLDKRYMPKVAA